VVTKKRLGYGATEHGRHALTVDTRPGSVAVQERAPGTNLPGAEGQKSTADRDGGTWSLWSIIFDYFTIQPCLWQVCRGSWIVHPYGAPTVLAGFLCFPVFEGMLEFGGAAGIAFPISGPYREIRSKRSR
jgi:hypothetical protein